MRVSGIVKLWLVDGGVPHYREMVKLGREVMRALVEELGEEETVRRFTDPSWLSSLACVLGFEWNTSGQTTVTIDAIKEGINEGGFGVKILGGKGAEMKNVGIEAERFTREFGWSGEEKERLLRSSRLSLKVDSAALQDSYAVYFHAIVLSSRGCFAVINQGMNVDDRTARRYHWSDSSVNVDSPHIAIVSDTLKRLVLDLTARDSRDFRSACLNILTDTPTSSLMRDLAEVNRILSGQRRLDEMDRNVGLRSIPKYLRPPRRLDFCVLKSAASSSGCFEEFLLSPKIGAASLRGLAYIANLIYGSSVSWKDPVKYAYAYGTKSGRPYYVDRRRMLRDAYLLRDAVDAAKVGDRTKIAALKRIATILSLHDRS